MGLGFHGSYEMKLKSILLILLLPELIVVLAACGEESTKEKCDPAYPTVCISPPPPDLDCNEISYRRFKVLRPDPHGFDRDGDGIGCESG